MKTLKLYLNNAGYCLARANHAIKGEGAGNIQFGALYALILHPELGWILFDTGYTKRFYRATRYFPNKIYAWVTKVRVNDVDEVKNQIKAFGLKCADVRYIIISHFHADHIAGLKDFKDATIYCSKTAYNYTKNLNRTIAFSKGVLKSLLPEDFEERLRFIEDMAAKHKDEVFGIKYDLFNDNAILVYELPGHAAGQIGIMLQTKSNKYFLLADACWSRRAYKNLELPRKIVKLFFHSWKEYTETVQKLHRFHLQNPDILLVPTHCHETTSALINPKNSMDVL